MSSYSRYLITASAIVNFAMALLTSFFPEELLDYLELPHQPGHQLFIQILGAFYLGFGMINYLSRGVIIGGIYNRPLLMGNIAYHGTASIVLIKYSLNNGLHLDLFSILMLIYLALGLGFLRLFFVSPVQQNMANHD